MNSGDLSRLGSQQLGMLKKTQPNEVLQPYADMLEGLDLWLLKEDVDWSPAFFRKFLQRQIDEGVQMLLLDHLGLLSGEFSGS